MRNNDFGQFILRQLGKDVNSIVSQLASFLDAQIIDRKFQEGFPGHELQQSTIRQKGHARVGEKTGALRRAATLWSNWSFYTFVPGKVRPAMMKQSRGLTAYADMVRTKIGGELDFLGLTTEDIVNYEGKIRQMFGQRGYGGDGKIRVIRK